MTNMIKQRKAERKEREIDNNKAMKEERITKEKFMNAAMEDCQKESREERKKELVERKEVDRFEGRIERKKKKGKKVEGRKEGKKCWQRERTCREKRRNEKTKDRQAKQ